MKLILVLLATFLVATVCAGYGDANGYGGDGSNFEERKGYNRSKGYGESRGYGVYRHRPRSRRGHRISRPGSSWYNPGGPIKTTIDEPTEKPTSAPGTGTPNTGFPTNPTGGPGTGVTSVTNTRFPTNPTGVPGTGETSVTNTRFPTNPTGGPGTGETSVTNTRFPTNPTDGPETGETSVTNTRFPTYPTGGSGSSPTEAPTSSPSPPCSMGNVNQITILESIKSLFDRTLKAAVKVVRYFLSVIFKNLLNVLTNVVPKGGRVNVINLITLLKRLKNPTLSTLIFKVLKLYKAKECLAFELIPNFILNTKININAFIKLFRSQCQYRTSVTFTLILNVIGDYLVNVYSIRLH
ncbi:uncharacterized protein LOC129568622 isoform X4 [Sitodiplosis mosellana]|uniref:uncharacterized protein LOC129568622 isoform X4 n=1 Tax=Sitodiplosis mosellana TaxID=263140 RepID=UPI0024451734|nr:uncharacterized protein LOC129568622 isoform X4 [Sitodiplosis mosellana]